MDEVFNISHSFQTAFACIISAHWSINVWIRELLLWKKIFCISTTKHVNCNKDDNFQGKYLPSFYLWLLYKEKKGKFLSIFPYFLFSLPIFFFSPFTREEIKLQLFWSEEIIRCFFQRKTLKRNFFFSKRSFFISLRWIYFLTRKFFPVIFFLCCTTKHYGASMRVWKLRAKTRKKREKTS